MKEEEFETERDFKRKYQSNMYVCSNCHTLINDKYTCPNCGWRSDGLFKTMGKGYRYSIKQTGKTEEIFKPIELINKGA